MYSQKDVIDEKDVKIYDSLKKSLTDYEKKEIFNYSYIYYIGQLNYKIQNGIFIKDDKFIIKIDDHIGYRFQIINKLGSGTYGTVIKTLDHKYNKFNAIKIFNNLSYVTLEKLDKLFDKEIEILSILMNRPITKGIPYELFTLFKNSGTFRNHNYIIFKLYGQNLYYGRGKIEDSSINDKLIIIKDIFYALEFFSCESPKIIHGDIKPENILFRNDVDFNVVIGDFGLSKILNGEYNYSNKLIQTRWYRSPEIIYNIPFNEKIDIWSVGCIIYEIISNNTLFKSKCDDDQLIFIHYILGSPFRKYIESHENIGKFYNYKFKPINIKTKKLKVLFPGSGCEILDKYFTHNNSETKMKYNLIRLVYMCLEYNISDRISSKESIDFINNFNSI
jgi:dual specificity tyrosine-phosphorylation-regulated kinase 2/3/4